MKDPEFYLLAMDAELACPVRSRNSARLEERYRAIVNHEVYFFGDGNARRKFEKKPYKYAGLLTDPVTLERFEPQRKSPRREHNDRLFYFASDDTRRVFDGDPEMYWLPRKQMAARPDSAVAPANEEAAPVSSGAASESTSN